MKPEIHIAHNQHYLTGQLRKYLSEKLTYLLEQNGTVSIGVSGGSMPKIFTDAILAIENLNWKRIRIFMVDERNVEVSDKDSNLGEYLRLFPEELHESFVPVGIHVNDVRATAVNFEVNLRKYLMPEQFNSFPRFDIVLLGVGPDGHTASLFPGKDRLEKVTELNWVSTISDSPKPPPVRVTLTMSSINYAKNVAFIITGVGKAEIVRGIMTRDPKYPSATVHPINEKLDLFLDEGAATGIPPQDAMSSPEPESPPPPFEG